MTDERIQDAEERIEFLRDKARREGFDIPDDVLGYIAEKAATPYALKSALVQVHTVSVVRRATVDVDFARSVLGTAEELSATDEDAEREPEQQSFDPRTVSLTGPNPRRQESEVVAELEPEPEIEPEPVTEPEPEPVTAPEPVHPSASAVTASYPPDPEPEPAPVPTPDPPHLSDEDVLAEDTLFATPEPDVAPTPAPTPTPAPRPVEPGPTPAPSFGHSTPFAPQRAIVWFAPMRTTKKDSLVGRSGRLIERAGLDGVIADGDLVAVKLHFGERGNTGFVQPIFLREVVARVKEAGGRPFLTDSNTLYRGSRANAVDHLECAIQNGFGYSTVEAPLVIADGLDGRDAVDVRVPKGRHFDSVRIGSAAVHADSMVVVSHVKGHEATGFGGALKNLGMGFGCRSAKQQMHADFRPDVTGETCTACGRCVKWCPVDAITIGPDRVAAIDRQACYGCGECVAACPEGAIAIQWETTPESIQEKIVEHAMGALEGKTRKVIYLSFVTDVSPDCDCWHFSDAAIVPDIGVLASTDIVAIERAAYDLVSKAQGLRGSRGEGLEPGSDKFAEVTGIDGTHAIRYAEELGLGTQAYELRQLD